MASGLSFPSAPLRRSIGPISLRVRTPSRRDKQPHMCLLSAAGSQPLASFLPALRTVLHCRRPAPSPCARASPRFG
ncbi:hypothetical protein OsI_25204 [Oryza sativa Indica Group]|uniref:Uncharacterized protein n=1 Tax=Oryza sativa subsp. indica TaxID=39946 RepID=B8B7Z6_ORYSI|nr:hypothetical protein OsI_25204 [Oryza sativa Indica Group]